jgi:hypothetical protein
VIYFIFTWLLQWIEIYGQVPLFILVSAAGRLTYRQWQTPSTVCYSIFLRWLWARRIWVHESRARISGTWRGVTSISIICLSWDHNHDDSTTIPASAITAGGVTIATSVIAISEIHTRLFPSRLIPPFSDQSWLATTMDTLQPDPGPTPCNISLSSAHKHPIGRVPMLSP